MEVLMEEIKWVKIIEVFERAHADLVESYFKAHGIKTEVVQEAYYEYQIGGAAFGRIQILVPNYQLDEAQELYATSGWNFDTTEPNDDEADEESE
jgi:hypothetical protein